MDGLSLSTQIKGLEELTRKLRDLEDVPRKKAYRAMVRAGGNQMLKVMRRNAPRDSGALRKALAVQVRYATKDVALARIGVSSVWMMVTRQMPNGQTRTQRVRPVWYAHLTERDVKPHSLAKKDARIKEQGLVESAGGGAGGGGAAFHPGYRGRQWMARSVVESESAVVEAMAKAAEKALLG